MVGLAGHALRDYLLRDYLPKYSHMSLFKRSVVSEITSHAGVVFSTLLIVWLSVLLVRLLGEAAAGNIGADVVLGMAALSTITALPIILLVSLFIAVLTTVTRNYRESEMVVWFASGLSLADWLKPVLTVAVPVAVLVAWLSMEAGPWSYRQIGEYRQRFEQRSDLSKVTAGQFAEAGGGKRVFFAEDPTGPGDELGNIFARVIDPEWHSVITAHSAHTETMPNGDRFVVLNNGHRYDLKLGTPEIRLINFERFGLRLESRSSDDPVAAAKAAAESSSKARSTWQLMADNTLETWSQVMWRISMPLAAINLALLAIPLGAVNPRLGRSGDLLIAGLVAMLYMNLINLSRAWISDGKISFGLGVWLIHALVGLLFGYLLLRRLRVKAPKNKGAKEA
jgi:lipopolysaccharide export system permease protein